MRKLWTCLSFPALCAGSMEIACCVLKQEQICSPVSTPLYQAWLQDLCRSYYLNSSCVDFFRKVKSSVFLAPWSTRSCRTLKKTSRLLVISWPRWLTSPIIILGWRLVIYDSTKIGELLRLFTFLCFFLGNHWYLQRHRCQNASDSYQDTLPF